MKYKEAPIIEAIFDLRVEQIEKSSIDKLEEIHKLIEIDYPTKRKQINYVGQISIKGEDLDVSNQSTSQLQGFVYSNKDNTCQVQFRLDGFTFNMLKPYSEWKFFSEEALKLWSIYRENLNPKKINRIGITYINRIEIPQPMIAFQEYITNMPPIPKCLPQTFNNFFMQIIVPTREDEKTNVTVTETIEPVTEGILPFILNIGVFKEGVIENNIDTLKLEFEKLRELKNMTFENCITDKTRKLFE